MSTPGWLDIEACEEAGVQVCWAAAGRKPHPVKPDRTSDGAVRPSRTHGARRSDGGERRGSPAQARTEVCGKERGIVSVCREHHRHLIHLCCRHHDHEHGEEHPGAKTQTEWELERTASFKICWDGRETGGLSAALLFCAVERRKKRTKTYFGLKGKITRRSWSFLKTFMNCMHRSKVTTRWRLHPSRTFNRNQPKGDTSLTRTSKNPEN